MKGPGKVPAFLATWLRVKPQFARQDGLKHGTMPQRWFWWGWVCFNGGGGTKKAGVKAGFGGVGGTGFEPVTLCL